MCTRKPYPSDVSDDEWTFVAPYFTLMTEDAPQRDCPLREVFNGLRWMTWPGVPWRLTAQMTGPPGTWFANKPNAGFDIWIVAGSFEAIVHDLRMLLRVASEREAQPIRINQGFRGGLVGACSNPRPKVALGQAMMVPSEKRQQNGGGHPRAFASRTRYFCR